jgi:hypothetical protein
MIVKTFSGEEEFVLPPNCSMAGIALHFKDIPRLRRWGRGDRREPTTTLSGGYTVSLPAVQLALDSGT